MIYVVDKKGKIHQAGYCSCFKCKKNGYLVPATRTIWCLTCKKPVAVFEVGTLDQVDQAYVNQIFPKPRKRRRKTNVAV